jgi:hypothetical protein
MFFRAVFAAAVPLAFFVEPCRAVDLDHTSDCLAYHTVVRRCIETRYTALGHLQRQDIVILRLRKLAEALGMSIGMPSASVEKKHQDGIGRLNSLAGEKCGGIGSIHKLHSDHCRGLAVRASDVDYRSVNQIAAVVSTTATKLKVDSSQKWSMVPP